MRLMWILFFLSSNCWAYTGSLVTGTIVTNPGANTTLTTTGNLSAAGVTGANYKVSFVLTGTVAMLFRVEVLNGADAVQRTIYVAVPANDTKVVNFSSTFFIPNGWEIRVVNQTAVLLGGQLQASIAYEPTEID